MCENQKAVNIETLLNEYVKNRNISKKSVDKNTKRC